MTPKFPEALFDFSHTGEIPEHIDGLPSAEETDIDKFRIEEIDLRQAGIRFLIAANIDTVNEALNIKEARNRHTDSHNSPISKDPDIVKGIPFRQYADLQDIINQQQSALF